MCLIFFKFETFCTFSNSTLQLHFFDWVMDTTEYCIVYNAVFQCWKSSYQDFYQNFKTSEDFVLLSPILIGSSPNTCFQDYEIMQEPSLKLLYFISLLGPDVHRSLVMTQEPISYLCSQYYHQALWILRFFFLWNITQAFVVLHLGFVLLLVFLLFFLVTDIK